MNVLNTCELRWAFEHVKGLKGRYKAHDVTLVSNEDGREANVSFIFNTFGGAMHSWFERFFKINYKSADSAAGGWKGLWTFFQNRTPIMFDPNSRKNVQYYTQLGMSMARRFYEEHSAERDLDRPDFEKSFNITVNTGNFQVNLKGRPDRLHYENVKPVITDYKTGQRHDSAKLATNPQFSCYSLAHERQHGEKARIDVYYPGYDDVPKRVVSLNFLDEDHEHLVQELDKLGVKRKSVRERARDGRTLLPNYGGHCYYCPFSVSGECDAYNNTDKFRYRRVAILMPSGLRVERKRKPEGQRRFNWPRKDVIVIQSGGSYQTGTKPREPYTPSLFGK